ncbi:MAG: aldo/keto reductase [Saprospiraceae bacterium]|nr:aldo/keto reductase [Saprospiraceae bacterium]
MEYRKLGNTGLEVSAICLGTMTFGEQNTESEGHEQMSMAFDRGVNFIDTAEMYSVPGRKETQGSTERIVGSWLKKTGLRNQVILATKVTGPSPNFGYISPDLGFSRKRILDAIDKSLARLQTDYVDLYQLHWPERKTNCFGILGYDHSMDNGWKDNFEETLQTLDDLLKTGKIRHWGLSNETPWGVMRCSMIAKEKGYPGLQSIQNPYNLLNRTYEIGLAEISIRENKGLLAYSPLAFGLLSGKFHRGADTPGDRINKFRQMARYNGALSYQATGEYIKIAEQAGLSMAHMALSFVLSRPFVTSAIIGATNTDQLKENLESISVKLEDDVVRAINEVHKTIPNPAP